MDCVDEPSSATSAILTSQQVNRVERMFFAGCCLCCSGMDDVLGTALASQQLSVMNSGSDLPVIDLHQVRQSTTITTTTTASRGVPSLMHCFAAGDRHLSVHSLGASSSPMPLNIPTCILCVVPNACCSQLA
jgi:hypothetical protein